MATIRCLEVLVNRDANTIIPRQAWPWELPILEELYGSGSVVVSNEFDREFDIPETEQELARLTRLYGSEEESKIPYVEVVYGRSTNGMRQLQRAIAQSVAEEEGEAKRGPGRPKKQEAA